MSKTNKEHSGLWICGCYGANNVWEIFADGAIFNGEGTQSFKDKINEITSCGDNVIHSVFLYPFNTICKLFETKSTKYSNTYQTTISKDKGIRNKQIDINWCLTNPRINGNKVIYKDFERFSHQDFEFGEHPAHAMVSYLKDCFKSFDKEMRPQDWEYSYGYVSMGLFYDDELCSYLREDIYGQGRNIWYTKWYDDLTRCNKGGLLDLTNDIRMVVGSEYDGRSAYSSHMLTDRHFPVSKLRASVFLNQREDRFNEILSNDWWFFIHIPKEVEVPKSFKVFRDNDTGDYGIEYYDYLTATEYLGVSKDTFIEIVKQERVSLYYCQGGMLNKKFRDRVRLFYGDKRSLAKGDPKRSVVKQILELLNGKGLQKHDFKTDGLCRHHWAQGRNYIQPHMAYHCIAAQRYRMMSIMERANGKVKYNDTDCIVGKSEELKKLIEEDNKRIMCKNIGYYDEKLDAGTWKNEYEEDVIQVILGPKQRIIFTDKGIITKVAGIRKNELMANLNALLRKYNNDYNKVIDYLLINGIDDFIITTYEFDVVNGYKIGHTRYGKRSK